MRKAVLIVVLAAGLLGGCSATGLIYDNLPWLLRNRIDARFDLTGAQSSLLKMQIATFAEWHRREELPRYAAALERMEQSLSDGLTQGEIEELTAQFWTARARLLERAIPAGTAFLLTVSDEQIAEFEQTHREAMEEDGERLTLSPEEQAEARFARTIDNLEDWFGDFDAAQRERIRELLASLPDTYASWLRRRELRHRRFVELLRGRPTRAQLEDYLHRWWLDEAAQLPPRMRQEREQFWQSAQTFILAVDRLITARQREHALRRLRGYREDLARLSKTVPSAPRTSSRL